MHHLQVLFLGLIIAIFVLYYFKFNFQSFLTPCGGVLNVTNFFWPNVKVLVNTLLTSYKPSSMDVFSSRNRCFSHFSIWSIYKVGCRQVAQYISRLALSIVFKISFFRVQWSSNIFCQLLKTEWTWISKTPLIVPPNNSPNTIISFKVNEYKIHSSNLFFLSPQAKNDHWVVGFFVILGVCFLVVFFTKHT